jgi:MYXO-CTERM domain-containing protein
MKVLTLGLGVILAVAALTGSAYAGLTPSVPEVDASSITAALGVLSAGILVMRARRRE